MNFLLCSLSALVAYMLITWQLSKLPPCSGLREGAGWVGYGLLVLGYAVALLSCL